MKAEGDQAVNGEQKKEGKNLTDDFLKGEKYGA